MGIYKLSQQLEQLGIGSKNILYLVLRTAAVFFSALLAGLFLEKLLFVVSVQLEDLVFIFTGWTTMIFGFWGGLFYLLRRP